MSINKIEVEKIAELARLELTPEETDLFTDQLSSIISHVETLAGVNLADTPIAHSASAGADVESTTREDRARPSLGQKLAVENAPDSEDGYFKVPRVIGGN